MKFLDIVLEKGIENWTERNKEAFEELFGGSGGRYPAKAKKMVRLRAPEFHGDSGVPFSALIHPSNPDSGAFGGMSIVIFPVSDAQCLIAMGVGTQGLSPDENVLARPGHARKVAAICAWLNRKYGKKGMIAWAKQDPVRTDLDMPENVKNQFCEYASVFKRYGKEIYGFCAPLDNAEAAEDALKAFMDLNFEERGEQPLTAFKDDCEKIRLEYYSHLLPDVNSEEVSELLTQRRFLVLQGPPGTGKTRMALQILEGHYQGNGITVQFHPGMTYENFVGGLAPVSSEEGFGFKFAPQKGFLMQAAEAAQKSSKPFLLMIDEINRADLSKVLGEAIFLFEDKSDQKRKVKMPYDFGEPFLNNFLYLITCMC
jgi:5-methylcytosine-specific restriction protein B